MCLIILTMCWKSKFWLTIGFFQISLLLLDVYDSNLLCWLMCSQVRQKTVNNCAEESFWWFQLGSFCPIKEPHFFYFGVVRFMVLCTANWAHELGRSCIPQPLRQWLNAWGYTLVGWINGNAKWRSFEQVWVCIGLLVHTCHVTIWTLFKNRMRNSPVLCIAHTGTHTQCADTHCNSRGPQIEVT